MVAGTEGTMWDDLYAQRQFLHRVLGFPDRIPILIGHFIHRKKRRSFGFGNLRLDGFLVLFPQIRRNIIILSINGIHPKVTKLLVKHFFLPFLGKIRRYM